MQVLIPGHRYELGNFEKKDQPGQIIQFIQKEPSKEPGAAGGLLVTVSDGTTNEEVMKLLIDRMEFLHSKLPSEETRIAIDHIRQALYAQHSRTYERMQRGVEGKHLK